MKITLGLGLLFFVVLVGGSFLYTPTTTKQVVAYSQTNAIDTGGGVPAKTQTNTNSTTVVSFNSEQVATHGNAKSCWATINGSIYDLTKWISQHPGGEGRILSICGKDGSLAFNGQHGGDPRALSVLATFKIGTLIQ
jgi:cytochrome b involved in lipid metabolism